MTARAAALVAATLIQVTFVARLDPSIPEPNVPLLLVVVWAWTDGGPVAMRWALAAGLLLDLTATGPIGLHALCLLAAAYAAGLVAMPLGGGSPLVSAAAGAVAAAVYAVVLLVAADALGLAALSGRAAVPVVAGQVLVTAVLSPLAVLAAGLRSRQRVGVPA